MGQIEKLQEWVRESDNIVFFGGAGVSTESGIPDFRSVDGKATILSSSAERGYPQRAAFRISGASTDCTISTMIIRRRRF